MLVAASVCPHPPLLVPEVAQGAAAELDGVRAACDTAVRRMLETRPDITIIVGDAPQSGPPGTGATGSLVPHGVKVTVPLTPTPGGSLNCSTTRGPAMPLSLTIGAWLLSRSGWSGERTAYGVSAGAGAGACQALGASLADGAERVGLLVMGDGSARRSVRAPGYHDPRARAHDAAVAHALACADVPALARLDATRARELLVAGRASWQVLAGAAGDAAFRAELLVDEAPYGVGYFVAIWVKA